MVLVVVVNSVSKSKAAKLRVNFVVGIAKTAISAVKGRFSEPQVHLLALLVRFNSRGGITVSLMFETTSMDLSLYLVLNTRSRELVHPNRFSSGSRQVLYTSLRASMQT